MSDAVTVNQFIVQQLEGQYRTIKLATDDLSDEQLVYQPAVDANSIAWLIWHLSRWRDSVSAAVSGESQIWVRDEWAVRFGLSDVGTGLGDTIEQVAAFRVEREMLFGYLDAAHQATRQRVTQLTQAQLDQVVVHPPETGRPAWQILAAMCGDSFQHAGQIAYLRGVITGHGWRERAGMS
ncbi:DinB family protein [Candidatus Entotheonella palauensis]|uniref:DinB-like domain-containing protein n=1 Tax=Candidatus Entotheonella gemina TaxID=1429439 RepID=W4MG93_9BACT|nr:DinB family protein [Candidatus Entotheonella palauensis]ETX09314.1 MAG: hypothetical protein ETSY2_00210 [Candidatus Entotheonella gemina]